MTNQQTAANGKPLLPWIIGITLVAAAVIVMVVAKRRAQNQHPIPPVEAALSPAEAYDLVDQIRIAIGDLENEEFKKAITVLCPAAEKLPQEPIVIRNRAISYVAPLLQAKATDENEMWKSLEALEAVEPDSFVTHWLVAKAANKKREQSRDANTEAEYFARAVSALERATKVAPENAVVWLELYKTLTSTGDDALEPRAKESLDKAFQFAPRNLYIVTEQIAFQRQHQDRGLLKTIDAARKLLGPLKARINRRLRIDLDDYFDKASAGVEASDWQTVNRLLHQLNAVRSENVARSDMRRIESNALEYVVHTFSKPFRDQFPLRAPTQPDPSDIHFAPVSLPGVEQSSDLVAVEAADFDLDEAVDLLLLSHDAITVYGHPAAGEEWTLLCRLDLPAGARGLLVADLDRDNKDARGGNAFFAADVDLIVYGDHGFVVLENQYDAGSKQRSLVAVAPPEDNRQLDSITAATLADVDHDGDLDLAVAAADGISLWSNRENLTFEEITQWSQLPPKSASIRSVIPVDWDRDVDIDLVLAGPDIPPGYLENLRHGEFRWREFDTAFALDHATQLGVLEADGNASWDLLASTAEGLSCLLTSTAAPGNVTSRQANPIAEEAFSRLRTWDYDNDGFLDVLAWNAKSVGVYRGLLDGRFAEQQELTESFPKTLEDVKVVHFDADGDLDLVALASGKVVGLENQGGTKNSWLSVQLMGIDDEQVSGRVNHFAIGSLLEIKSGDRYQAQVVRGQETHFGIGSPARADVLRALLTNGIPQAVIRPEPNTVIHEKMRLKGSCPYVYTWNGEQFEFFTDLLWAAPIGLQLADGVLAPARASEYLKIDGDKLKDRNGEYVLQVTEELLESGYFDTIRLMAVDHPADVEVFSNEKVGPAEMAEFKVHTVRHRRFPVAALDSLGRDVRDTLRAKDGHYWRGYKRRIRQGLVDEHFLELDLGDLSGAKQITLFLTGWIFPTDTSLNVALSGNPNLEHPHPPAIQVPDANGKWQETVSYMGFPGGKTKTIAIDLSNVFLTDDYRLRIVTSAEIYWDEVFFTLDEAPAETRLTELQFSSADLHYRGFSRPLPKVENAPEIYDYTAVTTSPQWPPMSGNFTKYGDVRELLDEADDRLVVMGAGDEVTLAFAVPTTKLPDGWTRDFIMHNVGWDKDADLNTIYGEAVEPLPWRNMPSYPYLTDDEISTSPTHQEYLKKFQTRRQDASRFWRLIENGHRGG